MWRNWKLYALLMVIENGATSELNIIASQTYEPAIPLLGICPKNMKAGSQPDKSTPVFIAAVFTIAPECKQPKLSPTGE